MGYEPPEGGLTDREESPWKNWSCTKKVAGGEQSGEFDRSKEEEELESYSFLTKPTSIPWKRQELKTSGRAFTKTP